MNRLKEIRARHKVRQFDLTVRTGIPQFRISFIENELVEPEEDEKKKLAKALGEKIEYLFPREQAENIRVQEK